MESCSAIFIMNHRRFIVLGENMMGNSLHNKIYLGRASVLESSRWRAVLLLGTCLCIGLAWLALRAIR